MADTVFLNGQVITVDRYERIVEAVAVSGNRISAVGTNEEVSKYIGPLTRVIDLEGKSLLPGFIDSHLHITIYGTNKLGVDCKRNRLDRRPAGSLAGASIPHTGRKVGAGLRF